MKQLFLGLSIFCILTQTSCKERTVTNVVENVTERKHDSLYVFKHTSIRRANPYMHLSFVKVHIDSIMNSICTRYISFEGTKDLLWIYTGSKRVDFSFFKPGETKYVSAILDGEQYPKNSDSLWYYSRFEFIDHRTALLLKQQGEIKHFAETARDENEIAHTRIFNPIESHSLEAFSLVFLHELRHHVEYKHKNKQPIRGMRSELLCYTLEKDLLYQMDSVWYTSFMKEGVKLYKKHGFSLEMAEFVNKYFALESLSRLEANCMFAFLMTAIAMEHQNLAFLPEHYSQATSPDYERFEKIEQELKIYFESR